MTHVETRSTDAAIDVQPRPNHRKTTLAVLAAYVVAAAFRIVLSANRTGPLVVGDEIGYLAHARVLAGLAPIDLSTATYYYSGSSLLMVPAFWFTDDPETAYQVVLILQALVSAAIVPLLYALCRELGVARGASLAAACVAGVASDSVFWTNYALSEPLLATLTAAWAWLMVRLVRQGRSRSGLITALALGVVFGLMAATHSRGVLLVAVGAVVGVACVRWSGWWNVLACAGATLLTTAAGLGLNVYTMRTNYPGRSLTGLVPASSGSGAAVGLGDQLASTLGQVWYVAAATGLVGLYGVLYAWYRAAAGDRPRSWLVAAGIVTLAFGALTFGSASVLLATAHTLTPDIVVYGRYVSSCMPLLIALGVVWLLRHAGRTLWVLRGATIALAVGLTAVVRATTAGLDPALAPRSLPIPTVFTLAGATGDTAHVHELRVAAVAVVFFAACCAVSAIRSRWASVGLVTLLVGSYGALSIATVHTVVQSSEGLTYPAGASLNLSAVSDADVIAWDTSIAGGAGPNHVMRMNLAYWAEEAEFVPFDGAAGCPPDDVESVAGARAWNGEGCGYQVVTRDPAWDIVIWQPEP